MASSEFIIVILTALGLFVSIIYYSYALRDSTKTRQAQLFMEIYQTMWTRKNSEIMMEMLEWKFVSPVEFTEKYGPESNPEAYQDWAYFANLFEGIGVLVKERLVNIRLVSLLISGYVIRYWEKFEEVIIDFREKKKWPRAAIELEYLYTQVIKYGKETPN